MFIRTRSFVPAIIWFVFITILFVLPGSDFPDEDWFHKIYLDKWVHSGFFFLLVYLFEMPFILEDASASKWLVRITAAAILYGIAIEFIQKWWVPGRSFDVIDMIFDSIGSIAAFYYGKRIRRKYSKK
jgi:VanZ family protein